MTRPQPEYHPAAQQSRRERSGLAFLLLAALVLGAVVLGVWMYNALLRGDVPEEGPAAAPTTTSTAAMASSPTSSPASAPTTTVTSTVTPTTPTTEPAPEPEPAYRAPDSAVQCAANVNWRIFRANDRTSCGLAEAVAVEMAPYSGAPGSVLVTAHSPVTGGDYEMACAAQGGNSFVCEGGDNAVVILEDRSVRD